jgi:hypothetical protein
MVLVWRQYVIQYRALHGRLQASVEPKRGIKRGNKIRHESHNEGRKLGDRKLITVRRSWYGGGPVNMG